MKTQQTKPPRRRSDNFYIALGLLNRYGAAFLLVILLRILGVLK